MKRIRPTVKLAVVLGLALVASAAPRSEARPPVFCPDVYAPVRCSDGNVYSNSCYAAAAGATGCVPYDVVTE